MPGKLLKMDLILNFLRKSKMEKFIKTNDMSLLFSSTHSDVYKDKENKIILKHFTSNPHFYKTEKINMEKLNKIKSIEGHIPRLIAADDKGKFIVMDYKGVDSLELANDGKMSAKVWWECLIQLSHVLDEMRRAGYVHRDVKPENMVYDENTGKWSFIDFAFSHSIHDIKMNPFKGTYPYCAPFIGNLHMYDQYLEHNKRKDVFVDNDRFGFALSILSLMGHERLKDKEGGVVSLDMEPIYSIINKKEEYDPMIYRLALLVLSCINPNYKYIYWYPSHENIQTAFGNCAFSNQIKNKVHVGERNVANCWRDIINEKQKVIYNDDVQSENKDQESD